MKNPYAASHTKDSEILPTEWPLVTTRQLADAIANETRYEPFEINQGIHTLILARKAIGDAKLACARANKKNTRVDVNQRLSTLVDMLDTAMKLLPLTIIETRRRNKVDVDFFAPFRELEEIRKKLIFVNPRP